MNRRKPGLLESFGRSVDESFLDAKEDVRIGLERIRLGTEEILGLNEDESIKHSEDETLSEEKAMKQIKKILMARLEDIATPVGDDFSYSTILKWVKENHVGNQFYMIKYFNNKSKTTYLFVFFAKNEILLCDKKHPMICFISRSFPESISDLFNGKNIFIQKFE